MKNTNSQQKKQYRNEYLSIKIHLYIKHESEMSLRRKI